MKMWNGYGSEHSMNLVMIGKFKNVRDAEEVQGQFNQLIEGLDGKLEIGVPVNRYTDEVSDLLRKLNCYSLSPAELEQFLSDHRVELEGDKIILTTDESDVSAFFKLMIEKGAKVEIFSAHDHPESDYGRGK